MKWLLFQPIHLLRNLPQALMHPYQEIPAKKIRITEKLYNTIDWASQYFNNQVFFFFHNKLCWLQKSIHQKVKKYEVYHVCHTCWMARFLSKCHCSVIHMFLLSSQQYYSRVIILDSKMGCLIMDSITPFMFIDSGTISNNSTALFCYCLIWSAVNTV